MTGSVCPIGAALFGFLYAPAGHHRHPPHHQRGGPATDAEHGRHPIWPLIALSNIAQASAVVGIIPDQPQGERAGDLGPAAISAYLGVTEPAMYGINLKNTSSHAVRHGGLKPAALICGFTGVMANGIGVGGLPGILSIQPQYWGIYAIAMLVAIVVPALLTLLVYKAPAGCRQAGSATA